MQTARYLLGLCDIPPQCGHSTAFDAVGLNFLVGTENGYLLHYVLEIHPPTSPSPSREEVEEGGVSADTEASVSYAPPPQPQLPPEAFTTLVSTVRISGGARVAGLRCGRLPHPCVFILCAVPGDADGSGGCELYVAPLTDLRCRTLLQARVELFQLTSVIAAEDISLSHHSSSDTDAGKKQEKECDYIVCTTDVESTDLTVTEVSGGGGGSVIARRLFSLPQRPQHLSAPTTLRRDAPASARTLHALLHRRCCCVSMTDGAVRTVLQLAEDAVLDGASPRRVCQPAALQRPVLARDDLTGAVCVCTRRRLYGIDPSQPSHTNSSGTCCLFPESLPLDTEHGGDGDSAGVRYLPLMQSEHDKASSGDAGGDGGSNSSESPRAGAKHDGRTAASHSPNYYAPVVRMTFAFPYVLTFHGDGVGCRIYSFYSAIGEKEDVCGGSDDDNASSPDPSSAAAHREAEQNQKHDEDEETEAFPENQHEPNVWWSEIADIRGVVVACASPFASLGDVAISRSTATNGVDYDAVRDGQCVLVCGESCVWLVGLQPLRLQLLRLASALRSDDAFRLLHISISGCAAAAASSEGEGEAPASVDSLACRPVYRALRGELHETAGFAHLHAGLIQEAFAHFAQTRVNPCDILVHFEEAFRAPPPPPTRGDGAAYEGALFRTTLCLTSSCDPQHDSSEDGPQAVVAEFDQRATRHFSADWVCGRSQHNRRSSTSSGGLEAVWASAFRALPLLELKGEASHSVKSRSGEALRSSPVFGAVSRASFIDRCWEDMRTAALAFFESYLNSVSGDGGASELTADTGITSSSSSYENRAAACGALYLHLRLGHHREAYRLVLADRCPLHVCDVSGFLTRSCEARLRQLLLFRRGRVVEVFNVMVSGDTPIPSRPLQSLCPLPAKVSAAFWHDWGALKFENSAELRQVEKNVEQRIYRSAATAFRLPVPSLSSPLLEPPALPAASSLMRLPLERRIQLMRSLLHYSQDVSDCEELQENALACYHFMRKFPKHYTQLVRPSVSGAVAVHHWLSCLRADLWVAAAGDAAAGVDRFIPRATTRLPLTRTTSTIKASTQGSGTDKVSLLCDHHWLLPKREVMSGERESASTTISSLCTDASAVSGPVRVALPPDLSEVLFLMDCGDWRAVRAALLESPRAAFTRDAEGNTLLHHAVARCCCARRNCASDVTPAQTTTAVTVPTRVGDSGCTAQTQQQQLCQSRDTGLEMVYVVLQHGCPFEIVNVHGHLCLDVLGLTGDWDLLDIVLALADAAAGGCECK